jgi:hypothetical protein
MHVPLSLAALLLQQQALRSGFLLQLQLLALVELKQGRCLLSHLLPPLLLLLLLLLQPMLLLQVSLPLLVPFKALLLRCLRQLLRRRRIEGSSLLHAGSSSGLGVRALQQCGGHALEHRRCSILRRRGLQMVPAQA